MELQVEIKHRDQNQLAASEFFGNCGDSNASINEIAALFLNGLKMTEPS